MHSDPTVRKFLEQHDPETARVTLTSWQSAKYLFFVAVAIIAYQREWKWDFFALTGIVCIFYLAAVLYKVVILVLSLSKRWDIQISDSDIAELNDDELPMYTVLLPLYKEANIAEKLVHSVGAIDYPREKLDVKLLLEEADRETCVAMEAMDLPDYIEVIVVPASQPQTKPKACNWGLERARGEYTVIWDAEDRPEQDQLKKAVLGFRQCDKKNDGKTACLQAKLNYYNPRQNWLTKFFALEYTAWFDLFLPGLNALGVPIPLGGTSNHFKTSVLKTIGGWDPYNVAEDCDLGMRLYKMGYQTRVLDSTTWEEATSRVGNWIRQRSRWAKGFYQTHLVHTRSAFFSPSGKPTQAIALAALAALFCARALFAYGRTLEPFQYDFTEAGNRLMLLDICGIVGLLGWGVLHLLKRTKGDTIAIAKLLRWLCTLFACIWVPLSVGRLWGGHRGRFMPDANDTIVPCLLALVVVILVLDAVRVIRQFRGIKGYASFTLSIGGMSFILLLNPICWVVLGVFAVSRILYALRISDFYWQLWYTQRTSVLEESAYDPWSVVSWVFVVISLMLFLSNFFFIAVGVAACLRRDLRDLYMYALMAPIYWVLLSIAAWKGFLQLIWKPHYWEATDHGHDQEQSNEADALKRLSGEPG